MDFRLALVPAVLGLLVPAYACSSSSSEIGSDESNANAATSAASDAGVGDGGAALTWPTPGTTNNRLDTARVLKAMQEVRREFYETASGYDQTKANGSVSAYPPNASETDRCLSVCPANWSDIVSHYYSWMPSYDAAIYPNIRECFSFITSGNGGVTRTDVQPNRKLYYPEAYDYCVYQDYDQSMGKLPPFDPLAIAANQAAGKRIGQLAWIKEHQDDVFKAIMYTWYDPFTYSVEDQQTVLNAFYGVTLTKPDYTAADTADVQACFKRPRRPMDPADGTHCSSKKSTAGWKVHPSQSEFVTYMQTVKR